MARDDFPAQSEGFVLTHFIVADDVARSRDFYTGVLGGTAVMGGEPTIVKLDPPRRRLEGQPCQVRQVGARDRARRRGRPSAEDGRSGSRVESGRGASLSTGPASPARPLPRFPPPWPRGLLLRELIQEHVASATRRARPGQRRRPATRAITLKPRGRGTGAWWIQAVAMKRLRTLAAASFPTATGAWCRRQSSARSTAPAPRRPGTTGQDPGARAASMRSAGARQSQLAWLAPRHRPRFVSFLANRETAKQPNRRGGGAGGGRDVPATTQAAPHRSAPAVVATAGRSWPARGLAGRLQARPPSREGGEGADGEGHPEARRGPTGWHHYGRAAHRRPSRAGAGPGDRTPQDDSGDGKPGPKPDTQTETATAEPPTNQ
jgi:hypothetical protein